MIKFIFSLLIIVTLALGGSVTIWKGLSIDNDIMIFIGVIILLAGVALGRFRFWSNLMD